MTTFSKNLKTQISINNNAEYVIKFTRPVDFKRIKYLTGCSLESMIYINMLKIPVFPGFGYSLMPTLSHKEQNHSNLITSKTLQILKL